MLKLETPNPETEEVTHVVELETWWTLPIDNGEEISEVDITICYERIDTVLSFTKIKMDLEEWETEPTSISDELGLRVWIHRELVKIFEKEDVDSIGIVTRQIVDVIKSFVNDNDIQGVF